MAGQDTPGPDVSKGQQVALDRLERFSQLMDNAVRIPFTRFTVGLDSMVGLIPVVGDISGLLLSGYVLMEAQRAGASRMTKARMVKNVLIDAVVGSVPLLGDAFDAMFKANIRNTRLLRRDLERQRGQSRTTTGPEIGKP